MGLCNLLKNSLSNRNQINGRTFYLSPGFRPGTKGGSFYRKKIKSRICGFKLENQRMLIVMLRFQ